MSVEMAIWRMTDDGPRAIEFSRLGRESELEDMIVEDPSLAGLDVLVIGRQIITAYGGAIDVLAVDEDGHLHVLELKREKTPRDTVAQTLDYGSWVLGLTLDEVTTLYAADHDGLEFEDAFAERFARPLPDVFNADQQLTIVASELDPASDRIVEYLADRFEVPINAVFFQYFLDGDSQYLARTWLLTREEAAATQGRSKRRRGGGVRPWNGLDYYVIQGTRDDTWNRWDIARRFGLLSAGGGSWYWKPLRNLVPGKRVFAYVGKVGYVGVGTVTGRVMPAREAKVEHDGRTLPLVDAPGLADGFVERARSLDEEVTEMVVPVSWERTVPLDAAISETGLFASQVTACKLVDDRTREILEERFGLTHPAM